MSLFDNKQPDPDRESMQIITLSTLVQLYGEEIILVLSE
jgi:hypothetical protein